jgi:hypothetical protein
MIYSIKMLINQKYKRKEADNMLELEKRMQEEPFDVEVQYCDPDDCAHDCLTAPGHCNTHFTSML